MLYWLRSDSDLGCISVFEPRTRKFTTVQQLLFSNIREYLLDHQLCFFGWERRQHTTSSNAGKCPISPMWPISRKPNHGFPRLMSEASQPSRTFWIKTRRNLQLSPAAFAAFWTCDTLWRIQQPYSSKEIPSSEPYFDSGKKFLPVASMEHFYESQSHELIMIRS
ncbi:unnamed protein product [Arabidopsis thaliana]|uniref:(thale cress) hypothetical protein n=1 Tax=Arabidopsis thaliana TaxID=3702 RepID=A0A7G2ERA8_ARATH|nr:unnamed protein product [Arabidopsis thaliana]